MRVHHGTNAYLMPEPETNHRQNNNDALSKRIVSAGLATAQQVQDCLKLQQQAINSQNPSPPTLADLLIDNKVVTKPQIDTFFKQLKQEQKHTLQIPGYKIIKKIGQGAMATVYLAKQLSLDRMVAIKVLSPTYTDNPEFSQRLNAEGRAAAKLNHPNIVGALDVGKAGHSHYFVMEYIQGRTVLDDITRHKHYTESQALKIAIQIASALDHAHNAGFIHRDVKPSNIMITSDGVAKLTDMGLARTATDHEAAESEKGKAFGTPYYISPEQIRGDPHVDLRADIYCFGATLYHMVTGRVPFEGPNPSAVMHKHLKAELIPPDHINTQLSAGVSEIIEYCMEKKRSKRYRSAAGLLEDLKAVTRGTPPLQARRKFNVDSLTAIEHTGQADPTRQPLIPEFNDQLPLTAQPIFWLAVSGWAMALVLLIILTITS